MNEKIVLPFLSGRARITQVFTPGVHNGIDMVGVGSDTIVAPFDGQIESAVEHPIHYYAPLSVNRTREFGCYVKIRADDGTVVFLCHLAPSSICVGVGDRVGTGTKVGVMGNTGYSLGAHLHIEVRNKDNIVTEKVNTPAYMNIPNRIGTVSNEDLKSDYAGVEKNEGEETEMKEEYEKLSERVEKLENDFHERVSVKYAWVDENMPSWAREDIEYLYKSGVLRGDENGRLGISFIELRMLCVLARLFRASDTKSDEG